MHALLQELLRIPEWLIFLGALAITAAGASLGRQLSGWYRGRRHRRRLRRAQRGEHAAAGMLKRHGYRVLAYQPEIRSELRVDRKPRSFTLRADYLVERRGKSYVAEVKTGSRAPHIGHAPTRRQLLEYLLAYRVDGVLLVNAEASTVQLIEFDMYKGRGTFGWSRTSSVLRLAMIGATVTILLMLLR